MKPSSDVLLRLSLALGVKPKYFFHHTTIELTGMQFRKRANLPVKMVESLKQRTIDFLERYTELEDILGIQEKFSNPLSNFSINSYRDVENAA